MFKVIITSLISIAFWSLPECFHVHYFTWSTLKPAEILKKKQMFDVDFTFSFNMKILLYQGIVEKILGLSTELKWQTSIDSMVNCFLLSVWQLSSAEWEDKSLCAFVWRTDTVNVHMPPSTQMFFSVLTATVTSVCFYKKTQNVSGNKWFYRKEKVYFLYTILARKACSRFKSIGYMKKVNTHSIKWLHNSRGKSQHHYHKEAKERWSPLINTLFFSLSLYPCLFYTTLASFYLPFNWNAHFFP
jgi:hypothetical protein